MKLLFPILGVLCSLLWSAHAAPVDLGTGTIALPAKVLHRPDTGLIDGTSGSFVLPDGLIVRYAISELGEAIPFVYPDGSRPLKEEVQEGVRYYFAVTAKSREKELVVIFPTWSPTYFMARSTSDEALGRAKLFALRFKPKARPKA